MNMLRILAVAAVLLFSSCHYTNYYVVRHAEKASQTADDPELSQAGHARAQILADTLADKKVNRIYTSEKIRTQQTAAPTAELFGVEPIVVPKTETDQLITQLQNVSGKNVLVVRHSEELHLIVNGLCPGQQIEQIGDEYHHLFLIIKRTFLGSKQYTLYKKSYGTTGN